MSFLSIAFLTALPLLAAPVLLHLFDRQRNVVIGWGAMQFLIEASTRQRSARRIVHWLLLLIRVAALAALIFALSRPLAHTSLMPGSGMAEVIIVLDNSMSTTRTVEDTALWDSIVERAERMIGRAADRESVRVMAASPYPTWLLAAGGASHATADDWSDALRSLRPTAAKSDLQGALIKAVGSAPGGDRVTQRRVVVLTDGQANDWQADDTSGWSRFREALASAPIPTWLDVDPVGDVADLPNLAVDRLRTAQAILGVNQPLTVTAQVHNFGGSASPAAKVQWLVDGEMVHDAPFAALEPDAARDVTWTGSLPHTGVFTVTCRIDAGDALAADNDATVVVEVVDRVPVLLVEGAAELADLQQESYLVQAALGRIEAESGEGWQAVFDPRTIAPQQLESVELDEYRAVVIPNLGELSSAAVAHLAEFVSRGGGLWIALGPRTDVAAFNRLLFQDGDGLSPVGIDRMIDETQAGSQRPTLNPFLKHHPATVGLADDERLDTGEVKVARRFGLRMPEGYTHVPVLLDLSSGEPLAVERRVGEGRVIVQAIPLRLQWSDLAVSQAFVVMVHDWLTYLCEPRATRYNLAAGRPLAIHLPDIHESTAVLTLPDGSDVDLAGEQVAGGMLFQTSRTVLPGIYRMEIGVAGDTIPFHVARDRTESDLRPIADEQLAGLITASGLDGRGTASGSGFSGGRRRAVPVWPWMLMLLIVLIAADLLLSGKISRGRFGPAGIEPQSDALTIPAHHVASAADSVLSGSGRVGPQGRVPLVEKAEVVCNES